MTLPTIFFRRHHFDLHHRLKQASAEAFCAIASRKRGSSRDLERHHRGVHIVEGAVIRARLEVEDREAGEHTGLANGAD